MPIANNLLADNVANMTTDISGWSAAGGTISRINQPIRATNDVEMGNYSMRLVSDVAGTEVAVTTVSRVPVAAGTEYVAYVWASIPSAAGPEPFGIDVRWFDSAGALISASTADDTYVSEGFGQRLTVQDVSPAGAVEAEIRLRVTVVNAGYAVFLDGIYLGPVPNDPDNLLTYQEYSQETGLGAWVATGATLERKTDAFYMPDYIDGSWQLKVTPTVDDVIPVVLDRMVPVTAGKTYAVHCLILAYDAGGNPTTTARTSLEWFNALGESLGVAPDGEMWALGSETGNPWDALFVSRQLKAPDGASQAKPRVEFWHKPESTTTFYYVDSVVMKESTPTYHLTTDNEAGMITVEIDYPPPWGTVGTYTLRRVDEDGRARPVRGYVGDLVDVPYTQTPIIVEDYEAPLGSRVWYRVDWVDVDGDTGWLYTDPVDSPVLPDSDHVWLKSPGLPALNRQVVLEQAPAWKRQARSAAYQVVNRRNPVNVSEVRGGRTGALALLVLDWDTNDGLDKLLDNGLPALLQAMPGNGLDGNLYLALGDSDVKQVSGRPSVPGWRWSLGVTEIDRPAGGLQGSATATWQTVLDTYATWDDLFKAAETWAEVLTD